MKARVPRFKNIKKRQFIIFAESLKYSLVGIFSSKVASFMAGTWLKDELLNMYF